MRRTKPPPGLSLFCYWGMFFCFSFVFLVYVVFSLFLAVTTSAINCLERLVSRTCVDYYVLSGTLNPAHLAHVRSRVLNVRRQ